MDYILEVRADTIGLFDEYLTYSMKLFYECETIESLDSGKFFSLEIDVFRALIHKAKGKVKLDISGPFNNNEDDIIDKMVDEHNIALRDALRLEDSLTR